MIWTRRSIGTGFDWTADRSRTTYAAMGRFGNQLLRGGVSGRCEHEQFVESVVLGPSERVVVDVLFDLAGAAAFEHRAPGRSYDLGSITVGGRQADPGLAAPFETLHTNHERRRSASESRDTRTPSATRRSRWSRAA